MRAAILLLCCPLAFAAFQPRVTLSVSRINAHPSRIIGADFNRDGIPDIVSANSVFSDSAGSGSISILLGGRVGALASFTELRIPGSPGELLSADFNRDGRLDIGALSMAPNALHHEFCVYLGDGAGGFGPVQCSTYERSGDNPIAVDINRDNILDIVSSRGMENGLTTILGNGNGTFRAGPAVAVNNPRIAGGFDWTSDGFTDLAIYNTAGTLTLLRGGAGGEFTAQSVLSAPARGSQPVSVDLNRDGRPEILISSGTTSGELYVFRANSAGFDPPSVISGLPVGGARERILRVADTDRDGDLDVIVSSTATAGSLLKNDGLGNLSVWPHEIVTGETEFVAGDFNGDSLLDLVLVQYFSPAPTLAVQFGIAVTTMIQAEPAAVMGIYGHPVRIAVRLFARELENPAGAPLKVLDNGVEIATGSWTALPPPASVPPFVFLPVGSAELNLSLSAGGHSLTVFFPGTPAMAASTSPPVAAMIGSALADIRIQAVAYRLRREDPEPIDVFVQSGNAAVNEGVVRFESERVVASAVVSNGVARLKMPRDLPLGALEGQLSFVSPNHTSLPQSLTLVMQSSFEFVSSTHPVPEVASGAIATIALQGLAVPPAQAGAVPWPLQLSGVEIHMDGQPVPLSYAGPNQVNFLIPAAVQPGTHQLRVRLRGTDVSQGAVSILPVAPGIFTANGAGSGVPAALAGLYGSSGVEDVPVFVCDAAGCVPSPMPLGSSDQVLVLSLYGTGLRNASDVRVTAGGIAAEVLFAGAHPSIPGLDQINVKLDRDLFSAGIHDLVLAAGGRASNTVRIALR